MSGGSLSLVAPYELVNYLPAYKQRTMYNVIQRY